MRLAWIGKCQSDMAFTGKYFSKSVTYFGNNCEGNVCCCDQKNRKYNKDLFISFIIQQIKIDLGSYYFVFYNQCYAFEVIKLFPECKKYVLYLNSQDLLDWLSNKTFVRLWVNNIIKVLPFSTATGVDCSYPRLKQLFPHSDQFVVQENYSSGGTGSFIITPNMVTIDCLNPCNLYMVSPLIENSYSVNLNIIIGKNDQVLFPLSIQIIEPSVSPFIYRGSDFLAAKLIPQNTVDNIKACAYKISEKLAHMGYRGICGIDFIVQENTVYFVEINPRFQGSSFLINLVLSENGLPSLYELNEYAFRDNSEYINKMELENIDISYSFYKVKSDIPVSSQIVDQYLLSPDIEKTFMDGFDIGNSSLSGYAFRFISKRNMVSINPNNQINIFQNLLNYSYHEISFSSSEDRLKVKTLLLIQGLIIGYSAKKAIMCMGGVQEGTFDSIDLIFSNGMVVNCPLNVPFVHFSPFTLKYSKDKFELFYFDTKLSDVSIDKKDTLPSQRTHSGLFYSQMVQRNNNRIRIRHNSVCVYKQNGKGCFFCHAKNLQSYQFDLRDIEESFLYYLRNTVFDQIMIGGASNDRKYEPEIIKDILQLIRTYTEKSIYIMSVPPLNLNSISEYKKLGANEIAFNIEIFDDAIAQKLMPGKGAIPRNDYLQALDRAVKVFGHEGQVRSMLIVGLEPLRSFENGIEKLCQMGVSPMISPFRPMEKTRLERFVSPNYSECQRYFEKAVIISQKYKIQLGPRNLYNQNNTLNIIT